jgi:4-hydroxy-tetrahydrodipicolinate synthase
MGTQQNIAGLWLPLITPFKDGQLDESSLVRLVRHYAAAPIDGLILAATTGEGLTLDEAETERLVAITAGTRDRVLPIYLGVSGADTRKVTAAIARTAAWPIDGYLIPCPYRRQSRERDVAPPRRAFQYRRREGLLRRADANIRPAARAATRLRRAHRRGCAVLWSDRAWRRWWDSRRGPRRNRALCAVRNALIAGKREEALRDWHDLVDLARLLFAEPNPAPIKHWLWRAGLIDSAEVRLPMTQVSDALAARIANEMARRTGARDVAA